MFALEQQAGDYFLSITGTDREPLLATIRSPPGEDRRTLRLEVYRVKGNSSLSIRLFTAFVEMHATGQFAIGRSCMFVQDNKPVKLTKAKFLSCLNGYDAKLMVRSMED